MVHLKPSKISSQNAFLTGLWRVSLALSVGHRLLGNTELVWMSENPALWPHGCRLLCSYEFPKLGLEPRAVVSVVTLCDRSASPGTEAQDGLHKGRAGQQCHLQWFEVGSEKCGWPTSPEVITSPETITYHRKWNQEQPRAWMSQRW